MEEFQKIEEEKDGGYGQGYIDGYKDCLDKFQESLDKSSRRQFRWSVGFIVMVAAAGLMHHINIL